MALVDIELPAFPPELEQTIFELTALLWPRSISRLMLVAWRVKLWVEPLLYRTIIVDPYDLQWDEIDKETRPFIIPLKTLLSLIDSKPPTFFHHSVHNLCLYLSLGGEAILSACSGIENLWCWLRNTEPIAVTHIHSTRPLKRLHASLQDIFGSSPIDFTHPLFSSMTHLEIFDTPNNIDLAEWSALTRLPYLTHLAFNKHDYLPMCGAFLPTWATLQVLVFLCGDAQGPNGWNKLLYRHNVAELADEHRLVFVACPNYLEDWIDGAHTGCGDYWSRAENHVVKRKSGTVSTRDCFIRSS